MGLSVLNAPAVSSGPTLGEITTAIQSNAATVSSGNSAGWRRTSPGGLTLVASASFSTLDTTNTTTISNLSGYSFYRLFIIGYFNSHNLMMRLNSNSEARYESYTKLGGITELQRRATNWRINLANAAEFNSTIMDIYDADSANFKLANSVGTSRGSGSEFAWFSWSKAEALSSITLFTETGANFVHISYLGGGYYLYGGY